MAEYDSAVATALRLINLKGKTVTFKTKGLTTPDANEPWNKTKGSPTPIGTPKAVEVSLQRKYANRENIRETDIQLLVAASGLGFVPSTDHLVDIGSDTYQVVAVDRLKPGDQDIMYTVILRG